MTENKKSTGERKVGKGQLVSSDWCRGTWLHQNFVTFDVLVVVVTGCFFIIYTWVEDGNELRRAFHTDLMSSIEKSCPLHYPYIGVFPMLIAFPVSENLDGVPLKETMTFWPMQNAGVSLLLLKAELSKPFQGSRVKRS